MPSILVGVDPALAEGTRDALALARALAAATGARVHLVCTYPWSAMAFKDEDMLRAAAERALAGARELVDAGEVTSEAIPARAPAGTLHEAASRHDADLVVVGSSHRGALGHALAGDVAGSLLHGAQCPVAVAPYGYARAAAAGDSPRIAVIGVAFADTPAGRAALQAGCALAARMAVPVKAISVADPAELSIGRVLPEHERRELLLHEMVARDLDAVLEQSDDPGGVETIVCEGNAATVLTSESEHLGLLVCGAGAHGPGGHLLGSTTRHLLRAAACPLVIVPADAAAFTERE